MGVFTRTPWIDSCLASSGRRVVDDVRADSQRLDLSRITGRIFETESTNTDSKRIRIVRQGDPKGVGRRKGPRYDRQDTRGSWNPGDLWGTLARPASSPIICPARRNLRSVAIPRVPV